MKRGPDLEALLAFQLTSTGIPAFVREHQYIPGRKFRADFAWPALQLAVEVQGGIWRKGGGAHSGGTAIERDIEKAQLAVLHGWSVLPVTTDEVRNGKALQIVEKVLIAKGWKR